MHLVRSISSDFSGPLAALVKPVRYSNPRSALAVLREIEHAERVDCTSVHTAKPSNGTPRTVIKVSTPGRERLLVSQPLKSTSPDQRRDFVEITGDPSISRATLGTTYHPTPTLSVVVGGIAYAINVSELPFSETVEVISGARVMVVDQGRQGFLNDLNASLSDSVGRAHTPRDYESLAQLILGSDLMFLDNFENALDRFFETTPGDTAWLSANERGAWQRSDEDLEGLLETYGELGNIPDEALEKALAGAREAVRSFVETDLAKPGTSYLQQKRFWVELAQSHPFNTRDEIVDLATTIILGQPR